MKLNKNIYITAGLASLMSTPVIADTTVEQGVTMTYQSASDSNLKSEILGSFDLVLDSTVGKSGHVIMYVEGASTPLSDGVSAGVGEANGDAGSAYNYPAGSNEAEGAFQVSELFYQQDFSDNFVAIGMMDAGAYFDGGEIANDEGASFISGDLVNNTTIEGPSNYTMGIGGHIEFGSMSVNLFAGGAVGYDGDYTELLHFQKDTDGNEKGMFTLAELTWASDSTTVRAGFWANSNERENIDKSDPKATNTGIYVLGEKKMGNLIIQGRFGQADDKVSETASFLSVAGEYSVGPGALGLGYAMSKASQVLVDLDSTREDRTTIEAFYRYEGGDNWTITPAFASFKNPGLSNVDNDTRKATVSVYTVRVTYGF